MERVAEVLSGWARERGEPSEEGLRWRAAAFLHDALRDADPEELRGEVAPECAGWPGPLLHGPAAAARLRADGVDDEELLWAVAFHTVGHPDFGPVGTALYCADFLEPGRELRSGWRRELRDRFPDAPTEVAAEVVAARVRYLLERRRPIFSSTIGLWNRIVPGPDGAAESDVDESAREGGADG